ncbi:hypothetical protein GUJ93_ZPchr0007g6362 [Zizania palustris]|uniref:Uncharacterized protein n=1 Tax=Zizania palustris TaxID=103762 RepID=A0A8J5TGQ4_ZIZPA|nr:hypothetical protein GUJ93_ZPchr0007g6362 [Zizania palustris]
MAATLPPSRLHLPLHSPKSSPRCVRLRVVTCAAASGSRLQNPTTTHYPTSRRLPPGPPPPSSPQRRPPWRRAAPTDSREPSPPRART